MNSLCFLLFCRCCCCWRHSTRRSGLKSVNTTWRSVFFSKGMETSLNIFLSEGNMNIQAVNIDDIYPQYNELVAIFFSANLDWFLPSSISKERLHLRAQFFAWYFDSQCINLERSRFSFGYKISQLMPLSIYFPSKLAVLL